MLQDKEEEGCYSNISTRGMWRLLDWSKRWFGGVSMKFELK
jgi:hypothetical protein